MRLGSIALLAILTLGCHSTTEPSIRNVGFAYERWAASHPSSYQFDLTITASTPRHGPLHITVAHDQVVSAIDDSGAPIAGFTTTIDTIWRDVLDSRARGDLNSAEFTFTGVPIEVDMGNWALDSGVHYSIRNFSVTR